FIAIIPVLAACSGGISTPPTGSSGSTSGASTGSGVVVHRTFLCGSGLACEVDTQLCNAATGFPTETNTSYSCDPIPTPCLTDHPCTCVRDNDAVILCSEGSDGSISVATDLP